jgi:hypothetical protein
MFESTTVTVGLDVHARSIRLAAVRADEERVYVGYWFWGRPSPYKLWDDLESVFRRLKPDFDPTTAQAKAAWKELQTAGKVPAHH